MLAAVLLGTLALLRGWVGDDASITFHVVEMLRAGHGPVSMPASGAGVHAIALYRHAGFVNTGAAQALEPSAARTADGARPLILGYPVRRRSVTAPSASARALGFGHRGARLVLS